MMKRKEDFMDIDKAIRIAQEYGKWISVDKRLPKRIKGKMENIFRQVIMLLYCLIMEVYLLLNTILILRLG